MTPSESVVMDWLLERGYTREQASLALAALTLPAPHPTDLSIACRILAERDASLAERVDSAWLTARAVTLGYLPTPEEGT